MPAFRTILVAADFSERSVDAFRVACSLAEEKKTRVFVLHVVEVPIAYGELGVPMPIVSDLPALQARLRAAYVPDRPLDVAYLVHEGLAVEEILDTARRHWADLVVLGTHGRSGLLRLLAGSVAEAVLRRAECPVLALRGGEAPARAGEAPVILHPTDFSGPASAALRVARALARDRGARLRVLHVVPEATFPDEGTADPPDLGPAHEALDTLRRRADGPDLKFPVEVEAIAGDVVDHIVEAADWTDCDLLVLGTHGRTGLGRLVMGSVAEDVLRRSDCPVLLVKGREPADSPAPKPAESANLRR